MRIVLGLCLALVLVAATPSESSAQAVAQVITLEVAPAQMPAFLAAFARAGAAAAPGDATLWQNTVGGAPNQLVFVSRFESLEAWAAAQTRNAANTELQQIIAEILASGVKIVSSSLQSQLEPPQ